VVVLSTCARPWFEGQLPTGVLSVGRATVTAVVADVAVVSAGLAVLGCAAPHRVLQVLTAGGSGAQVFLLELPTGRAVLKVTGDLGWRDRARRELGVYLDLAGRLGVGVPAMTTGSSGSSSLPTRPTRRHRR